MTFSRENRPWLILFLAMPLIFFAAFSLPPPLGRGVFPANDFSANRIWWAQMDTYFITKGYFPLWNPTFEMGHPWLAMSTGAGSYYPLRWWTYLPTYFGGISNYLAQYLQISLHISWAMAGLFFVARQFGKVSAPAAALGATVMLLNQQFNTFIRFPHGIENMSWIPWILFLSLSVLETVKSVAWKVGALAACICMSWLTGYGQFTYVGCLMVGLICIAASGSWRQLIYVGAGGLLGTILSIGAIYPAAEWVLSHPLRNGKQATHLSLLGVTEYLSILTNPFGVDVHVNAFTYPLFLVLAVIGISYLWRQSARQMRISLGMVLALIFTVDVARGPHGVLFEILYRFLPFFGAFNGPAKDIWLAFIPLSWFVAIGTDRFVGKRSNWRGFSLAVIVVTALLILSDLPRLKAGAVGNWQPLRVGWLDLAHARSFYAYLVVASLPALLCYLFTTSTQIRISLLLGLTWLFSFYFATQSTWVTRTPDPASLLGTREAFPGGLLGRRSLQEADLSRIGVTDPIVDPPMWALLFEPKYQLIRSEGSRFPDTRFLWQPQMGRSVALLELKRFTPNLIEFEVKTEGAGALTFLTKSSSHWKASMPFHLAEPFHDFIQFDLKGGAQFVRMEFRPIGHWVTGVVTMMGLFSLLSVLVNRKRFIAVGLLLCGGLCCGFIIVGMLNDRPMSPNELFGKDLKSLDQKGRIEAFSEIQENLKRHSN